MQEQMLDAVVATSPENFYYTVGVALVSQRLIPERLAMAVWRPSGDATALVEGLEEEVTRRRGWITDVRTYGEHVDGPVAALAGLLGELGIGAERIGIEARALTHATMLELARALPNAIFIPCDSIFDALRVRKSKGECERIEVAAGLFEDAIARTAEFSQTGMSEREIGMHMMSELTLRSEGRLSGLAATVASGPNAHVTHHGMADRRIEDGDLIRLGCRGLYDGYHGIVMRTGVVGRPKAEQQKVYRDLHAIHADVIGFLRPGTPARAVYRGAERAYESRGYALPLPHVGHSIGLSLQERPKFQPRADERLVIGMTCVVVTVIASSYGRFYLEDLVAIDESGPRALSRPGRVVELLATG
jgi:Xaa-Pro dipeptidase